MSRKLADVPRTAFARTAFRSFHADGRRGDGEEKALNSFLLCRDALVDQMKQATRNRLSGLLQGLSQSRIAAEEGATQGAISQSLARSGAFAIVAAQESLEGGDL